MREKSTNLFAVSTNIMHPPPQLTLHPSRVRSSVPLFKNSGLKRSAVNVGLMNKIPS